MARSTQRFEVIEVVVASATVPAAVSRNDMVHLKLKTRDQAILGLLGCTAKSVVLFVRFLRHIAPILWKTRALR